MLAVSMLATLPARAQNISRTAAIADLQFLEAAVRARAPHDAAGADSFQRFVAGLESALRAVVETFNKRSGTMDAGLARSIAEDMVLSMPAAHHRLLVGSALQAVGDMHALVLRNPLASADSLYFPLPVVALGEKLYLMRQCPEYPPDLVGKEVESINGMPTADILRQLYRYAGADGGGTPFAEAFVRLNLIPLVTAYLSAPSIYTVRAGGQTIGAAAIRTVRAGVSQYPQAWRAPQAALRRGPNALHLFRKDSAALLVVSSFGKKDKKFFRRAFRAMRDAGSPALILDLRGNTGGSRRAAITLTKQLVDAPFGYSLVRPRGQKDFKRYLNRQGRMFYALGKVKYTLGGAMRNRSTPQGRAIRYRYKPVRNPFDGKLAVITDGLTASSSTMVTSWLKQHSKAVFVGSQAGGGYNGNWGGSFPRITLPKSGMVIQLPAYRLVLDEASSKRDGIVPDVLVRYTVEDVLTGLDADLEAAQHALAGDEER